jgi:hypothetical protein
LNDAVCVPDIGSGQNAQAILFLPTGISARQTRNERARFRQARRHVQISPGHHGTNFATSISRDSGHRRRKMYGLGFLPNAIRQFAVDNQLRDLS